jgi:serine/threonine-protein kinase
VEDQHLVQMALERKFITGEQVSRAKAEQKSLSDRGIERSLWFLLQDLGFIDDKQTKELRKYISSSRVKALEIDGYIIQGRLGSGGMGDVFRGRNAMGIEVAVKLLSTKYSQHEEYAARFQREAKASARLKHPHIARTLGAGDIEGQRWLMMELVPGKSLKEHINTEGPLPEADAQILLGQMAHALRYAWQRGVLHRDVKPANIILAPAREGRQEPCCAKLCDFGLAKTWQIAGEEVGALTRGELTHSGVALGTPHYMSPEQASGESDLDQRTDIYGLGATLYHALLGQTLYSGKSSAAIMYKQVTEALDLKPLEQHGISAGFVRLIGAMLAKDRARRLRDWDAVLNALRSVAPRALAVVEGGMPAGSVSEVALTIPDTPSAAKAAMPPRPVAIVVPPPRRLVPVAGLITVAAVASLVLAAAGFVLLGHRGGLRARPDTIAQVLLDAQRTGVPTTVLLEPGDYQGPFAFGVAHSHLTLSGTADGVRLMASSIGDEPLLRLQTGLSGFSLRNVVLVPGRRLAIDVQSGATAALDRVRVEGGCRQILSMGGGELRLTGLSARSEGTGLAVEGQGDLRLSDVAIASTGPALVLRHGSVQAERSRFSAVGASGGALVSLDGGKAEFAAVIIDAQGCDTALALQALGDGRLSDVALRGARTALHADGAALTRIDGLSADGLEVGIEWIGSRDPAWTWVGLAVRAPRPVIGLSGVDLAGSGARAERLQPIPLLAASPR